MADSDTKLFNTVPERDYLSFFPKGASEPNAESVVGLLELKKDDVSKATGVKVGSIRYDERIPPELSKRIREWAILLNLVAGHFQGDVQKTTLWFKMPNPLLGNMSPRDMIRYGRFQKLLRFVLEALSDRERR